MVREQDGRLHFGVSEWIGLAALALTPAVTLSAGLLAWGTAMDRRVTRLEATFEAKLPIMAEEVKALRAELGNKRE